MQNFKIVASFSSWAGRFESFLVAYPEDMTYLEARKLHKIWAASCQNQQSDCAPSEDSNPPSLIRVFAVRTKKAWVLSYLLSAQRRLWSDWADVQADLSLRWAHSHFVGFVMRWLIWRYQDRSVHEQQWLTQHCSCLKPNFVSCRTSSPRFWKPQILSNPSAEVSFHHRKRAVVLEEAGPQLRHLL